MDVASGKFISSSSGVFLVSFYFSADNNQDIVENRQIQKNKNNLDAGQVFNPEDEYGLDSTGKTILVKLDIGDELSVFMTDGYIQKVSFCVSSI